MPWKIFAESRRGIKYLGASTACSSVSQPKRQALQDDEALVTDKLARPPRWNKGKLIGAKPPLRPSHVWSIRTKLQIEGRKRDLALFNLAIDSKLRGCDVVAVRVEDVAPNGLALDRPTVRQRKTGLPVRSNATSPRRVLPCNRPEAGPVLIHLSRFFAQSDHRAVCEARR